MPVHVVPISGGCEGVKCVFVAWVSETECLVYCPISQEVTCSLCGNGVWVTGRQTP